MSRDAVAASRGWIIGPTFDLLFLVNAVWPIFFAVAYASEGFEGRAGVQFWQVYFVTTPHRWITLLVVFLDRDRLAERRATFFGLAVLAASVCLATRITTGTLTCLLTIDYLWNAWHFASQHHGVYRIYGRLNGSQPRWPLLEKVTMRAFLLYVIVRVAGGTWSNPGLERYLLWVDWGILIVPCLLIWREIQRNRTWHSGSRAYLLSVCVLYVCLLWAVHNVQPRAVLALTIASALFHAIEYLALISWSVQQRVQQHGSRLGWLHWFGVRWGLALLVYVAVLGIGGWFIEQQWLETWLLLNVIAAFLHYAYDGLIWRRSRTQSQSNTPVGPIATAA